MKNILIVSDIHLNDSIQTEYRWKIFDELQRISTENPTDAIFILGDITDEKDRHTGRLVNRVVDNLVSLEKEIYILRGNHDGHDPKYPFFNFLNRIKNIHFIDEPMAIENDPYDLLFYPHGTSSLYQKTEGISFFHETFRGTLYDNGTVADDTHEKAPDEGLCFSGDIHNPQEIGNVVYVGSPYPVRFGDTYSPRMILLNAHRKTYKSVPLNMPRKTTVILDCPVEEAVRKLKNMSESDMVRIQIEGSSQYSEVLYDYFSERTASFPCIKQIMIVKDKAVPFSPSAPTVSKDSTMVERYGESHELDKKHIDMGVSLVGKD